MTLPGLTPGECHLRFFPIDLHGSPERRSVPVADEFAQALLHATHELRRQQYSGVVRSLQPVRLGIRKEA